MNDPKKSLQEANGFLRTAQNNMFSGKNAEAVELLNKAEAFALQAKAQIPADFQVTSLFQKIEKMRKDLERKGVSTRPGGNNELPFEAQAQINRIREHIIRKELDWAKKELDIYYSRFAGPLSQIPQIEEFKQHIAKLEAEALAQAKLKADEEKSNALITQQLETQNREWETRLKAIPYFDGTPQNIPGLIQHKESFDISVKVLSEYETVQFVGEKSISLESLANDIKMRMQLFPSNFAETAKGLVGQVTERIEERIDFLNHDNAWVTDKNQLPHIIGKSEIDEFNEQINALKPLFINDTSPLETTLAALAKLSDMNQTRRVERSKLVRMRPEVVAEPESDEPKSAAIMALNKKYPGACVLKAAMVRHWESKRTEQWADSTKTQWIVKNISETTVQIAAELPEGLCKLLTIHIEKDINPNGTFGEIQSHVMFEELMAKEAVI